MASRFVGSYEHSLDGKGRVILPARYRSSFDTQAFISKFNEQCLAIWTPEAFDMQAAEMEQLMHGSPEERARARAFSAGSTVVDLDRQGRIAVPQYLREFAGLAEGGTVLVQGVYNHLELWNPPYWQAQESAGDAMIIGVPPGTPAPAPESPPAGQEGD